MDDRHGDYPSSEGPEERLDLASQLEAVRRRIWPMLAVFVLVLAIATAVALLWPPTYRSMGTILIEQQEVPLDYVRSAVTSYADERVEIISQRVMTTTNLLEIIEKYGLYSDERGSMTREQLVKRMRDNVKREMISAEVVDPRAGRTTEATIAFAVGFESPSPELAVRVANDLVTLYLQKNIETRKQLAAGTTEFLASESDKLRVRIAEIEQRLADFKARNYERLPEFAQSNAQMLAAASQEARDIDSRIQSLNQQIGYLDSQLAQINPRMPAVTDSGQAILGPAERLRAMREQYVSQLALYTPRHPSVASLKRELYGLEVQVGAGSSAIGVLERIEQAYLQLADARAKNPPDEAEVQQLERRVGEVVAEYKSLPVQSSRGTGAAEGADNPAYLSIQAQRQNAVTERSVLSARRGELAARIGDLERRQLEAPTVEAEYNSLQRELQTEQDKFADLRQKLLESQLAQNLEAEQKGERFTLIEPPLQPQEPIKPNRQAIFALGLLGAFASAIGLMVLLELLDTRIRGRRQVVDLLGVPPLAIIPWVAEDEKPRRLAWLRRLLPHRRGPSEAPAGA
jgi:succinoglycan biosynthesis transport protein ExoP